MNRKYLNWVGIVLSILSFTLGFVVLFAKIDFGLGIKEGMGDIKDEIYKIIENPELIGYYGELTKSHFADTLNKISLTSIIGWAAVITGALSFVVFSLFSLEEAGVLNTSLSDNKFLTYEAFSMLVVSIILFAVGFIVKSGIEDIYTEEILLILS